MKIKHSKGVFLPVAIFEATYNIGTYNRSLPFPNGFLRGLCILVIAKIMSIGRLGPLLEHFQIFCLKIEKWNKYVKRQTQQFFLDQKCLPEILFDCLKFLTILYGAGCHCQVRTFPKTFYQKLVSSYRLKYLYTKFLGPDHVQMTKVNCSNI